MKAIMLFAALSFTARDVYTLVKNANSPEGERKDVHAWFTAFLWAVFFAL